jgi:hypothetical protein
MADAITNPSDMFIPELAQEYLGYEFKDSLGVLGALAGPEAERPIRLINFGFLQNGGVYVQGPRFKKIAGLVARRDYTSNAEVDTKKLEARNDRGVQINLRLGPVAFTKDAEYLAGLSEGTLEREFASQAAQALRLALQSHLLNACYGILAGMTGGAHTKSVYAASGTKVNLSTAVLAQALQKLGDRSDLITAWVMRSEPYSDLLQAQLAAGVSGISDRAAAGAFPHTLGRNFAVVDHAALFAAVSGETYDKWYSLGLGPGFLELEFIRAPIFYPAKLETEEEQVKVVLRGDVDFALRAGGVQWDAANGGANPTEAALALGSNWDPTYSDHREVSGLLLEHNCSAS